MVTRRRFLGLLAVAGGACLAPVAALKAARTPKGSGYHAWVRAKSAGVGDDIGMMLRGFDVEGNLLFEHQIPTLTTEWKTYEYEMTLDEANQIDHLDTIPLRGEACRLYRDGSCNRWTIW